MYNIIVVILYIINMISILMPIYNGIEFIEESVQSVINQTYTNWELIIGINGHPMNSEIYNIARKYELIDNKIKVLDLYTIKGKGNALNEMLKYCKYDHIALLDVDDIWLDNKLEIQSSVLGLYDVIGSKCIYFGDKSKEGIVPNIPIGIINKTTFNITNFNPIINTSSIIKKELCYWNSYFDGVEDYDLWIRLFNQDNVFYNFSNILVKHRIHLSSAFNANGNNNKVPELLEYHKKQKLISITFSSCFYIIKSKFNHDTYINWMNKFISIVNNFNLVIYTDENSVQYINTNNNNKIKIIIKPIEKFYNYKYRYYWIKNHEKNDLLNHKSEHNTSWELNMLWSEKISFVEETYKNKYFETDYYGWCDIGYFRDLNSNSMNIFSNWPLQDKINKLNKEKIHYALINNDSEYINKLRHIIQDKNNIGIPNIPIPSDQTSIAGGFFITYKDNIELWKKNYDNKLSLYFKNNYLVKDDQMIIIDCIFSNENSFELHKNNYNINPWFLFQKLLL